LLDGSVASSKTSSPLSSSSKPTKHKTMRHMRPSDTWLTLANELAPYVARVVVGGVLCARAVQYVRSQLIAR
jgi:hypothetical protein